MKYTKYFKTLTLLTGLTLFLGGVTADLRLEELQTNPSDSVNISNVIEISGQVSEVSEPEKLDILVRKNGETREYNIETDEEGFFTKNVFAPFSTGEYTVEIRENGEELENSFSRRITVVSHPDIEVRTPEIVEVFEGNTEDVDIELTNTGDEKISSIQVKITNEDLGLNQTNSLESLEIGRTADTEFSVSIEDTEKDIYVVDTSVKILTEKNKSLTETSSFKLEKLTVFDVTGQKKIQGSEEESAETDEVTLTEETADEDTSAPIVGQLTVDEGLSLQILTPVILTILLGYLTGKISTRKGVIEPETKQGNNYTTPTKNVKVPEYAEEDGKFICEKTGKSFESKKGLELYQKLNNLE